MSKERAVWLLFLADIVSIWAVYMFFIEWHELMHKIVIQKPIIIKWIPFGAWLGVLVIPVVHIMGILSVTHRFKGFAEKWMGTAILGILAFYVVLIIAIEIFFSYKFEQAGYQYCSKMTTYKPGGVRQAYLLDPELCVHTFSTYHLD